MQSRVTSAANEKRRDCPSKRANWKNKDKSLENSQLLYREIVGTLQNAGREDHRAEQDVYVGAAWGYTEMPAGECSFSSRPSSVMQGDANIPAGDAEKKRGAETRSSLLAAAQLADPEAWRAIVYLYSPLVLGWCRRCGVHEADAEDVSQEVFQTIIRRMPEFKRERAGSFRAWLRQIAAHKLGDQFRRLRAEKGINMPDGGARTAGRRGFGQRLRIFRGHGPDVRAHPGLSPRDGIDPVRVQAANLGGRLENGGRGTMPQRRGERTGHDAVQRVQRQMPGAGPLARAVGSARGMVAPMAAAKRKAEGTRHASLSDTDRASRLRRGRVAGRRRGGHRTPCGRLRTVKRS